MNRRNFVRTSATASAAVAFTSRQLHGQPSLPATARASLSSSPPQDVSPGDPAFMQTLAKRAVEAATAAGATYAEARVTRGIEQFVELEHAQEREQHGLSVRALVRGGWGFSTSPFWTLEDAAAAGGDAARQATENARYIPTPVEIAPTPVVTGRWESPMKVNPFTVSIDEKLDFLRTVWYDLPSRDIRRRLHGGMDLPTDGLRCARDEHVLVTSEGTAITQHLYSSVLSAHSSVEITDPLLPDWVPVIPLIDAATLSGVGWEEIRDADYYNKLRSDAEKNYKAALVPPKQIKRLDVGRYTVVLGPVAMGQLLSCAIIPALNLDRITLRDADTTGTSYLGQDPVALLDDYNFGSPLLSVTAVPWLPGETPTHHWDNEGVAPENVSLVSKGVLQDFYTTREQATWLTAAYQKHGHPVKSHGYAEFDDWEAEPRVGIPRLMMASAGSTTLPELMGSVSRGVYITNFAVDVSPSSMERLLTNTDRQGRQWSLYFKGGQEIVNGRIGATFSDAAIVVDAVQLWKNLVAIGGVSSQVKGFVPALFTEMAIIDPLKR